MNSSDFDSKVTAADLDAQEQTQKQFARLHDFSTWYVSDAGWGTESEEDVNTALYEYVFAYLENHPEAFELVDEELLEAVEASLSVEELKDIYGVENLVCGGHPRYGRGAFHAAVLAGVAATRKGYWEWVHFKAWHQSATEEDKATGYEAAMVRRAHAKQQLQKTRYFQLASSAYLSDLLPPELMEWEDADAFTWVEEHAWDQMSDISGEDLWNHIANLADLLEKTTTLKTLEPFHKQQGS